MRVPSLPFELQSAAHAHAAAEAAVAHGSKAVSARGHGSLSSHDEEDASLESLSRKPVLLTGGGDDVDSESEGEGEGLGDMGEEEG